MKTKKCNFFKHLLNVLKFLSSLKLLSHDKRLSYIKEGRAQ